MNLDQPGAASMAHHLFEQRTQKGEDRFCPDSFWPDKYGC